MTDNKQHSTEDNATRTASEVVSGQELQVGMVRALLSGEEYLVELDEDRRVSATQAPSCLLSPCVGDRVLTFGNGSQAYILAVLERDPKHRAELQVPGADDVELSAASALTVSSPCLSLRAKDLSLTSRMIAQTGHFLSNSFRSVVESVTDKYVSARSLSTRADVRISDVKDVDTHKAGTLVQDIDTVATQRSEIAVVAAKEDVRIDAKRVTVS